jgi:hypothetical protein
VEIPTQDVGGAEDNTAMNWGWGQCCTVLIEAGVTDVHILVGRTDTTL